MFLLTIILHSFSFFSGFADSLVTFSTIIVLILIFTTTLALHSQYLVICLLSIQNSPPLSQTFSYLDRTPFQILRSLPLAPSSLGVLGLISLFLSHSLSYQHLHSLSLLPLVPSLCLSQSLSFPLSFSFF